MPKKRKTRKEKIILQLKRELAKKDQLLTTPSIKNKPRQGSIFQEPQTKTQPKKAQESPYKSTLSYHPRLIRQDLLKTFILTLIILSLELVLYWKLR